MKIADQWFDVLSATLMINRFKFTMWSTKLIKKVLLARINIMFTKNDYSLGMSLSFGKCFRQLKAYFHSLPSCQ